MSYVNFILLLILSLNFTGCAADKTYWHINDAETYWDLQFFSVKPPNGANWNKLPSDDLYPNTIAFDKNDVVRLKLAAHPLFNTTTVVATGMVLDEPIYARKDEAGFAESVKDYFKRYAVFLGKDVYEMSSDSSLTPDCISFKAKSIKGQYQTRDRFQNDLGAVRFDIIHGYFCIHPIHRNLGVIMESWDKSSLEIKTADRHEETEHFFNSLKFKNIPGLITRRFETKSYEIGKTPYQLVAHRKHLWAVFKNNNEIAKIDPHTGAIVSLIAVGSQPVSISAEKKGIWVANSGNGTVSRIDSETGRIVATIPVGGTPVSIYAGHGGVWVANRTGNSVLRIDPFTNSVTAQIPTGKEPVSLNAGKDGIWCANAADGTVTVIDPMLNRLVSTIPVGGRPARVSIEGNDAWIADEERNQVIRIDRKTKKVSARIEVGGKPSWIFSAGPEIIVALSDKAKIVRIEAAHNKLFGPAITLKNSPHYVLYLPGSIWTAANSDTTLTQISLNPFGMAVELKQ